jgi:hypothetical protein
VGWDRQARSVDQRHLVEGYDPIGSLTWVATDAFVICVLAV